MYKHRIVLLTRERIHLQKHSAACALSTTRPCRKEKYETEKRSVSKTDCNNWSNNGTNGSKEVDTFALTNSIDNMENAYQKFFKEHAGYPQCKSKHNSRQAYTTNCTATTSQSIVSTAESNSQKLAKSKQNSIASLTYTIKKATVSREADGA